MSFLFGFRESLFQLYKKSEIQDHRLQYLFLEITKKCNLNCLHCGSDCSKDNLAPELTTESWLKIIDYIYENFGTNPCIVITGGEPLLHADILKITSYISKKGMRWGMVTNGMTLNENILHKLIENNIYSITISVDGSEKVHNFLRNSTSAFQKMEKAVKLIGNSEIKYKDAVTCVFPKNLTELDDIAQFLLSSKIKTWRLFRIFPSGRAKNNQELFLSQEKTWEIIKWVEKNRKKLLKSGLDVSLSCEGWIPFEIDRKVRRNPFFCRAGINFASILSDGKITGCSNNNSWFYEGNIFQDDFKETWENGFSRFRDRKWLSNTVCKECKLVKMCNGSSIHLWHNGNSKPEFCYIKNI